MPRHEATELKKKIKIGSECSSEWIKQDQNDGSGMFMQNNWKSKQFMKETDIFEITFFLWDQQTPKWKRFVESVRAHVKSLLPTILRPWHVVLCFLLGKGNNQAFTSSLLEGCICSRYIFRRPQKCPKTRFFGTFDPVSLEN